MYARSLSLALGLTLAGLTFGAEAAGTAAAAGKPNLHQIMVTKVNPQALAIWDVTNNAMDDKGAIDARKITAAQWATLLQMGKAVEEAGRTLAASNGVLAAAPGQKLQDEGGVGKGATARDVQRYLDAKPEVFRSHAVELQKTGTALAAAATKRDTKQLGAVSDSLDGMCEGCHAIFWYPQQSLPK